MQIPQLHLPAFGSGVPGAGRTSVFLTRFSHFHRFLSLLSISISLSLSQQIDLGMSKESQKAIPLPSISPVNCDSPACSSTFQSRYHLQEASVKTPTSYSGGRHVITLASVTSHRSLYRIREQITFRDRGLSLLALRSPSDEGVF